MVIIYCLSLVLLLAALVFTASYYLGHTVYSLNDLDAIPFINNSDNAGYMQEQPCRQSYSFLVIGDIQAGYRTISRQIFNAMDTQHAFSVQTGDLVSHADEGHYALTLYELKKADLTIPLFVVPGNHDVKGKPELFQKYFSHKQYYFLWSNCLFIFLDNSLGAPYDSQFQFLEQTLSDQKDKATWTFIFIHRPPIDWEHGEPRPEMKNYSRFFDIQKRFRIDYVFSGHLHDYRMHVLNGTTYISNGLESNQQGRSLKESYYTIVNVSPEGISIKKTALPALPFQLFAGRIIDCLVAHVYPLLRLAF
jgi:predicted phosphodiesterase